ncbi:HAMP domain-containing sensor histidine kinase [Enterococcus pallens]|uniref:Signal transduction histidine-protein kinase ArlS n=1 Tax=Enterococcus pallens ATCC BAA-351 TaxID=1158607 RepID=R2QMN3_9ENTE|nr:HAMP domain-containing histidine kinase [Enterococcus pallens]EOH96438.1 two-component system sensor histidine kinase [Enterococcus pallens ATCC BAA-351]EOU14349.1 two-component system sensor histidine kinase [Enterococcus pallens ATCC BAA-351]
MRKLFKKHGELKGPSLTIKWAFTSSFFIFVVFTIFAVITYKSSVNLIVAKERNNVEKTISDVSSRLANSDEELTLVNTYRTLTESSNLDNALYDRNMTLEGNMLRIDSFVAELGQPQLSLDIYNLDKKLIFKTQEVYHPLVQTEHKSPTIVTLDDKNGFLSIEPIYSKETRERIGYAQIFYELSDFYEMRSKLLLTLIVLEIVSLVLSSFLGFLLSSYFLKPVKILRDTMEIIRQDPQADVHVPEITTNDELADLAMIFNDVIDRIRMYIKQQEQFVEDVSHELRTPVAVIEGHLSLLNRWGKDDPEILEESIQASLQEIERMKSLVQEMLDLSRAEQVDVYYGNETSNAKEVTYQVFNNFKLLYPEFTFTLDDDLENERQLKIYRNHLEQIMIIIMDNAVKYSTERKEVHISISSTLNEFEIAIQDFGEGIPNEDIDKVFNRFYRVDKARARTKGGNGLGLSIAHKLIESYKGHISVESSLGQGTIFRIFIPMVEEESAEQ